METFKIYFHSILSWNFRTAARHISDEITTTYNVEARNKPGARQAFIVNFYSVLFISEG